jgi:hypothetical protein
MRRGDINERRSHKRRPDGACRAEGRATAVCGSARTVAQREALGRLRSELISRMDRVDSAITAIRDDITVTMRLADRAQEAADQTRGELNALGDRVTAMMHQIQDLQAEVRHLKGEGPRTE